MGGRGWVALAEPAAGFCRQPPRADKLPTLHPCLTILPSLPHHPASPSCLPTLPSLPPLAQVKETKKIWGENDVKITGTCIRVPVMRAHAESINLEFEKDISGGWWAEVAGLQGVAGSAASCHLSTPPPSASKIVIES